ncbi:MAG: hypothetical protein EXR93_02265 [Gemmatimonadetes bacterium]|nr:hypothetical protein [Gemmatimonadota bacterium]
MMLRIALVAGALLLIANTSGAQLGRQQGLKDPNVATEAELAAAGLGADVAKALVAKRPFMSIVELDQFLQQQGLKREQIAPLYGKLFVHVNLEMGTRDEILLIPGAGPRMVREFTEYRPYTGGFAQFRKEIGKYVDSTEVARLEQYLFIPINLNTASDEDILSIPGAGRRMVREFKEYRPYDGLEKFRKEIGKYVDQKEVARLERYVMIK